MNLESPHSYAYLSELIEGYTTAASSHYAESPEDVSLMLLTVMDLWVALDKSSIHQHSFLSKYDPGFPTKLTREEQTSRCHLHRLPEVRMKGLATGTVTVISEASICKVRGMREERQIFM